MSNFIDTIKQAEEKLREMGYEAEILTIENENILYIMSNGNLVSTDINLEFPLVEVDGNLCCCDGVQLKYREQGTPSKATIKKGFENKKDLSVEDIIEFVENRHDIYS